MDSYKVKVDHRNASKAAEKSQWVVPRWCEVRLFGVAGTQGWQTPKKDELWSVEKVDDKLRVLGSDGKNNLHIAKYICDANACWHGYPVLPKQFDRPPIEVASAWLNSGLISNTTFNRWLQGKA